MSHHIYHSDGFVFGHFPTGEAHLYLQLFTREFGFIYAVARSVREEKSKLRYALQDHSFSHLSLVRGKDVWRVVGAAHLSNIYYEFRGNKEKTTLYLNMVSLLKHLLSGEEKNESLFNTVDEGVSFLIREEFTKEEIADTECILVLRILFALGYVSSESFLKEYLLAPELNKTLLTQTTSNRKDLIVAINESLEASRI